MKVFLSWMLQLIKIILICVHVWSGHSKWLFSCPLYIPCPTRACFTYTLLTGLNYLLAPGLSWWLFLSKRQWGVAPLLVSSVTNEPTWHQFPYLQWFLSLPWSEEGLRILPTLGGAWRGAAPGPCSRQVPPSVKQCLCCWLQALS